MMVVQSAPASAGALCTGGVTGASFSGFPSPDSRRMPAEDGPLTAIARRYLATFERGASFDELTQFFTDDCVFDEYPNRFTPNGATRDLEGARAAAARGAAIMQSQRYDVDTAVEQGNVVALEVRWTGTLSTDVLTLKAGDEMKARFGVFLTFRDGRIAHSRNYDCFEPW